MYLVKIGLFRISVALVINKRICVALISTSQMIITLEFANNNSDRSSLLLKLELENMSTNLTDTIKGVKRVKGSVIASDLDKNTPFFVLTANHYNLYRI